MSPQKWQAGHGGTHRRAFAQFSLRSISQNACWGRLPNPHGTPPKMGAAARPRGRFYTQINNCISFQMLSKHMEYPHAIGLPICCAKVLFKWCVTGFVLNEVSYGKDAPIII